MEIKSVAIGCDHAGYVYKDAIIKMLEDQGVVVTNFGTDGPESVDYPDFVHPVAEAVSSGNADIGILLCGSGNGVAMTANKHQDIRAALCWQAELAELARQHNNANILCLPARFISENQAVQMSRIFIDTPFDGGRHERRVNKIACS